jgi:ferredoxin
VTGDRWRVTVEAGRCIGSGICAGSAPGYFVLVDDVSRPVGEVVDPADAVTDAADSCPVEAIEVRDLADNTLIAPGP